MSFPTSVGQATHTLADTAARHTIVARLCTAMYQAVADANSVITQKGDFMAVREELALAVGHAYNSTLGVSPGAGCKGPVPVITNVAPFTTGRSNDLMAWYMKLFDCRTMDEQRAHISTSCIVKGQTFFPPELYFGGYVMSHNAHAHPMNGDTALTLFIGGVITVKNGRFPVKGGAHMQWYFEDEAAAGLFEPDSGLRSARDPSSGPVRQLTDADIAADPRIHPGDAASKDNSNNKGEDTRMLVPAYPLDRTGRLLSMQPYGERGFRKRIVCVKSCLPGLDGQGHTIMDWRRVFGVATGDAGPWEKVDIKIGRQSM